jgi:hypothetical protein
MTTSATNPDVFRGHKFGFVLYPFSHIKSYDNSWEPNRERVSREYAKAVPNGPLRFELPKTLGGTIFASPYDKPDPLQHIQAATKLFSPHQLDFATAADDAARRYLAMGKQDHDVYSHLHGIGSWENNVEPSMMTIFHKPVSGLALQKIGADVGAFARQHGILAFAPHPYGVEALMHMRVPTHHPMQRLTPYTVAEITHMISGLFNKYHDQSPFGEKSYLMPGRTILPDETGHSDVLAWVPPWEQNPSRLHQAFHQIADELKVRQAPQYWPGTGMLMGGTSPYSDEEASKFSDDHKRDLAVANYRKVLNSDKPLIGHAPQLVEPARFAQHAPAGSGAVVRGVFYPPGKIIPTIEPAPAVAPPAPMPPLAPQTQHAPGWVNFKKRVMDAYHRASKRVETPTPEVNETPQWL